MTVEEKMIGLGWRKEIHFYLNKNHIHYHKDGFEIREEYAKELLEVHS